MPNTVYESIMRGLSEAAEEAKNTEKYKAMSDKKKLAGNNKGNIAKKGKYK